MTTASYYPFIRFIDMFRLLDTGYVNCSSLLFGVNLVKGWRSEASRSLLWTKRLNSILHKSPRRQSEL